ncbi:MAG: alanine racemase, partial [Bacteroidales bacterium]|nr:alanine racemase [Bacteroidales bacterium]
MEKETFAQMEISTKAALHNFKYFRSYLKKETKLLILIKANSYGHGAVDFAKLMEKAGADYFAVAHPIEGIELRQGGIKTPIIVLTTGTDYYKEIIENGLEPGIPNLYSLKKFDAVVKKMGVDVYPVHIKLDTGMHRLGFMEKELPELLKFLKAHKEIKVQSIYSHLAASDEKKWDKFTLGQIALYDKMAPQIDQAIGYHPIHHILNSAGIERFSKYQKDMCRLGIGIYGVSAVNQKNVMPVASLKCRILQIKELTPEDGTVGYGRHGKITRPSKIATLPLGYADGI